MDGSPSMLLIFEEVDTSLSLPSVAGETSYWTLDEA